MKIFVAEKYYNFLIFRKAFSIFSDYMTFFRKNFWRILLQTNVIISKHFEKLSSEFMSFSSKKSYLKILRISKRGSFISWEYMSFFATKTIVVVKNSIISKISKRSFYFFRIHVILKKKFEGFHCKFFYKTTIFYK